MKKILLPLMAIGFNFSLFAGEPAKEFKLFPDDTFVPADKSFRIEQFANEDWEWQIWIFPPTGRDGYSLTAANEETGYAAFFESSPDSTWLFRSQKIAAGTNTAFLYHREKGEVFSPLKEGGLGELAWKFFSTQPGISAAQVPSYHEGTDFVAWEENRYLILELSGLHQIDGTDDGSRWSVDGWRCAFDLVKHEFVILPDQAKSNKGKIVRLKNGE